MVHAPLNNDTLARLSSALQYWQQKGYHFVNLPWMVPQEFTDLTKPEFATEPDPSTKHGVLVASGEQSFLKLWAEGQLEAGQGYIGWTPCFRNEPVYDAGHHFYFMKAELFFPHPANAEAERITQTNSAKRMFQALAGEPLPLTSVLVTEDQVDIELDGLELGSYGIRNLPDRGVYVYGTALAEPRFSTVLGLHRARRAA